MEKIVHNVQTGEISLEALSEAEIAEIMKIRQENEKVMAEKEAEGLILKTKRQALLDKLGITEEEARLLLS